MSDWHYPSTALYLAALNGHILIFEMLLEAGVDAEAVDHRGYTPLFFALDGRQEEIAQMISGHLATPPAKSLDCFVVTAARLTPLHHSCKLGLYRYARYLLEAGVNINATDCKGMTPLYCALP